MGIIEMFFNLPFMVSKLEVVILIWILIEFGFILYAVNEIRQGKIRAEFNEERINKFISEIDFNKVLKKFMKGDKK